MRSLCSLPARFSLFCPSRTSSRHISSTVALCGAVLAMVALAGCPPPAGTPDAGPQQVCENGKRVCDNSRVCGGGFCDKEDDGDALIGDDDPLGCCVNLTCLSDDNCDEGEKCDVRRQICINANTCDPADPEACAGGQLCSWSGGVPVCVAEGPAVGRCVIAAGGRVIAAAVGDPDAFPAITKADAPLRLDASAFTAAGPLAAHAVFTWETDLGTIDDKGTLTAPCASGVCVATVTAHSGEASCEAAVNVYAAAAAATSRIVVLDTRSGAPLAGVPVAARIEGLVQTDVTDDDGAATFDGDAENISAFPADAQWQTVIDPPNDDVVVFTARLPDTTKVAGVKGTFDFSKVHTAGDLRLGLAGTAIAASITDLDFTTIIGELADYNVEVQDLTPPGGQILSLPSGLVLELSNERIKSDYVAFGSPGENIAWAIGGKVPLTRIGSIITGVTGSEEVNVGSVLSSILPFFSTFDHGTVSGLNLNLVTRPTPPAEGQPIDVSAYDFPERVITPDTLLALSATYTMPPLPCAPGLGISPNCVLPADAPAGSAKFASGAVLLTGVVVPGQGIVPLGITAGLDDPDDQDDVDQADGLLDYLGDADPAAGTARIDYAPPHDGLEGNLAISVAIALDMSSINSTGGFGASILTHITPKFGANNDFPQTFLESQAGNFVAGADGSFTASGDGAASFYRVNLDNGGDTEWNVWFSDDAISFSVAELHPDPAAAAARVAHADLQAFRLGNGYDAVGPVPASFADLFGFNGTNMDNLLYYLGAWSSTSCEESSVCTGPATP